MLPRTVTYIKSSLGWFQWVPPHIWKPRMIFTYCSVSIGVWNETAPAVPIPDRIEQTSIIIQLIRDFLFMFNILH